MNFLRSVAVLVSGTALGHGVSAAALPILTRLYDPAEFSLLAVFAGSVSILSVAACLRFDVAVALPEKDFDALALVVLAISIALTISFGLGLTVLFASASISSLLKQPALEPFLWLVPFSVLLAGGYSTLQMWFVRHKSFGLVARSRVAQSVGGVAVQITGGANSLGPSGLLVGHAMNSGVACLFLGYRLLKEKRIRAKLRTINTKKLKNTWLTYKRFPQFSTFEALSNSASIHLPVIMIAALAAPAEAGYLMMASFVMQAPMALIGGAVGQVYLSHAAEEHRRSNLGPFTTNVLKGLLKSGVGPILAVGIISPAVFGVFFGASWERAGVLVLWMTPWFVMQFLATPISMGLHVTGHQRLALGLQLAGLAIRVLMVAIGALFSRAHISEWYAISGFLFYLLYFLVVANITHVRWNHLFNQLKPMIVVSVWVLAALVLQVILN